MSSRRCGACHTGWPYQPEYKRCPHCDAETEFNVLNPDIEPDEAASILAAATRRRAFDAYYEERCVTRFREELDSELGKLFKLPTK